jgi:hypothetical protein
VGKGSSSNLDPGVSQGMLANETALTQIAQQQATNAEQLYKVAEPGFQTAESFYSDLATGDPGAIMRAISPAAQQINQASAGAKENILATSPAGGEKNLALEMTDVNKGAQVGSLASSGYTGSFNALGQLAGQGVGESISASGAGTSAYSAGSSSLAALGGLNLQDKQLQMEQKGQSLGGFGSLLSEVGSVAGSQQGGASLLDAFAAL